MQHSANHPASFFFRGHDQIFHQFIFLLNSTQRYCPKKVRKKFFDNTKAINSLSSTHGNITSAITGK